MSFDTLAVAARDAAMTAFGRPVTVDPDGAALVRVAIPSDDDVTDQFGPITLTARGRFLRFRAEEAPAQGAILLMADGERRRVRGAPVIVGRRGVLAQVDTEPETM